MGNKITALVQTVSVDEPGPVGEQIISLQLKYVGEENISQQIIQDEELTIEIPSKAPPPEGKP